MVRVSWIPESGVSLSFTLALKKDQWRRVEVRRQHQTVTQARPPRTGRPHPAGRNLCPKGFRLHGSRSFHTLDVLSLPLGGTSHADHAGKQAAVLRWADAARDL